MDTKIVGNALITTAAIQITQAHAATDPNYEAQRFQLLKHTQEVVKTECEAVEGFDFDVYQWADYEVVALNIILDDVQNHTANYCKPPELTGMHQAIRAHPGEEKQEEPANEL